MAYSELPRRPFLGQQAWSWTTLRRDNVFYYVYKRFFYFCHVFTFLMFLKFLFERFFTSMLLWKTPRSNIMTRNRRREKMTRRGAAWIWHRKLTHQEAAPDRRGVSCLRLPRLKRRTIAIMLVMQCACYLLFSDVSIFYFSRCKTLEYSLHGDNDVCMLATRPPMAVVPAVPKSANVVSISARNGYPGNWVPVSIPVGYPGI